MNLIPSLCPNKIRSSRLKMTIMLYPHKICNMSNFKMQVVYVNSSRSKSYGEKMDEHSSLIFLFFILFYENNEF